MKKKLLILGLIMVMALTGCGKAKLSKDEVKGINLLVETVNREFNNEVIADFEEKTGTVNMVINPALSFVNIGNIKETYIELANLFFEKTKNVTIKYYYDDKEEEPLLIFENGELKEDDFDKFIEKNHDKRKKGIYFQGNNCFIKLKDFEIVKVDGKDALAITTNITNLERITWKADMFMFMDVVVTQGGKPLERPRYLTEENNFKPEIPITDGRVEVRDNIDVVFIYDLLNKEDPVIVKNRLERTEPFEFEIQVK